MNKAKKKLIVILGPTASGKTKLAVALAKKFSGEIISADSRQVYQGMDIGSGKDLNEYGNIPYHLIDVASPKKQFSLAKYQKQANKAIDDCFKRGRQPFLVGGSGLYLNAIIYGFVLSQSKPNLVLRKSLNQKTLAELQQLILKNKISLNDSDFRNKRRLIRKLEILEQPQDKNTFEHNPRYDCLILGVKPDTAEELLNNITKRFDFRLQKQGLVEEVENLKKSGLSWKKLEDFGLEYRFISQYLQGIISITEAREKIIVASRQFAKRQMTWFKKERNLIWLNKPLINDAVKKINEFLK